MKPLEKYVLRVYLAKLEKSSGLYLKWQLSRGKSTLVNVLPFYQMLYTQPWNASLHNFRLHEFLSPYS